MRIKGIIAWTIACLPFMRVRVWLYGRLPGYTVHHSARIGWLSQIDVDSLSLAAGSCVGRGCRFSGPMHVALSIGAVIGGRNRIECGRWYADFDSAEAPYAREFILGDGAMITTGHFFDATGGIRIGEGSWIAGRDSQFWTHGLGVHDRSIALGRFCYIGSAVRFAPGARIGDMVVVGLGSVVTHDFSGERQSLIAGVPGEVVRRDYRPEGWAALEQAIASGTIAYE